MHGSYCTCVISVVHCMPSYFQIVDTCMCSHTPYLNTCIKVHLVTSTHLHTSTHTHKMDKIDKGPLVATGHACDPPPPGSYTRAPRRHSRYLCLALHNPLQAEASNLAGALPVPPLCWCRRVLLTSSGLRHRQ